MHFPGLEILRELGRGTTGVVYEARHTLFNRQVALKTPIVASESEQTVVTQRFFREARALAALTNGPPVGIPTLHEVSEYEGQHYYLREFVAGDTLERRAAAGSIDLRAALAIVAEVAGIVQRVHEQGFAHRNLSAANVLVAQDGSARLIGFGRVGMLVGTRPAPPGDAATPLQVDLQGLRDLLWSVSTATSQPIPASLEHAIATATTAEAVAAAIVSYLQAGSA